MVDFRKFTPGTWKFLEYAGVSLRDMGVATITPEAVAVNLWNWDCDRPTSTSVFKRPERKELITHLAEVLSYSTTNEEILETDYSPEMLKGFEAIISEKDSVTPEGLSEWLTEIWLPEHYPQFFEQEQIAMDSYTEPAQAPMRNPKDDDETTGSTISEHCDNMLALAAIGKLHRALGRENEMKDLLLSLAMNTKNCPALIGKPGTGKTAIAEELAFRLLYGEIPSSLRNLKLYRLDYSKIRATGREESIMRNIIDEAEADGNLVLFIDEMHLLINNHPQAPNLVAQMLKPPMARGGIKIIGATTYEEYSQNIESDPAFERRFNPIRINEPDTETTKTIIRRSERRFNHGLTLSDETLSEAINLTSKYIKNRYLPAKAIELIDRSAAEIELQDNGVRELTPDDLRRTLSTMTGLPLERVSQDETVFLNSLEEKLHNIVIGQDHAVKAVSDAIRIRRSGFGNSNRPIGSFLFLGTTGTGKTLLSKAVAEVLFGDRKKMTTIAMSEYQEEVSITKLIGPSPGYIGYENGGTLTNAVIQNPYTVLLVDEMEKAHPAVHKLFLQVLDEGQLTDNHGRIADFTNSVVIFTSNICQSEILSALPEGDISQENIDSCTEMVKREIKNYLPLELVNRFDKIVMFEPITFNDAVRITELILKNKEKNLKETQNMHLRHSAEVIDYIAEKGYSREYGARSLERTVENLIINPLSQIKLHGTLDYMSPIYAYVVDNEIKFRN